MKPQRFGLAFAACAFSLAAACGGGLTCDEGKLEYNGEAYSSCDQCPSDDCSFTGEFTETCTDRVCELTSGSMTAACGREQRSVSFTDGAAHCNGGCGGLENVFFGKNCPWPCTADSDCSVPPGSTCIDGECQ